MSGIIEMFYVFCCFYGFFVLLHLLHTFIEKFQLYFYYKNIHIILTTVKNSSVELSMAFTTLIIKPEGLWCWYLSVLCVSADRSIFLGQTFKAGINDKGCFSFFERNVEIHCFIFTWHFDLLSFNCHSTLFNVCFQCLFISERVQAMITGMRFLCLLVICLPLSLL